jgi:hypothetical protein
MTLGLIVIFVFYDWNNNHELNHIFEFFCDANIFFQTFCKLYFLLIFFPYLYKTLWKGNVMEKNDKYFSFLKYWNNNHR